MHLVHTNFEVLEPHQTLINMPKFIEKCGRVCYKSEDRITDYSAAMFISNILRRGHEAVLEHGKVTVKIITNRGVTHEIVRHRLASYCQESTRYCNYSKEKFGEQLTFVIPEHLRGILKPGDLWHDGLRGKFLNGRFDGFEEDDYKVIEDIKALETVRAWAEAEERYMALLRTGATAQQARGVLPNDLKTEIVMTANIREWRHFFKLRTAAAAHPDMRLLAIPLLKEFKEYMPDLFADIPLPDDAEKFLPGGWMKNDVQKGR